MTGTLTRMTAPAIDQVSLTYLALVDVKSAGLVV
jgi:hypothetical protein